MAGCKLQCGASPVYLFLFSFPLPSSTSPDRLRSRKSDVSDADKLPEVIGRSNPRGWKARLGEIPICERDGEEDAQA